MVRHPSTNQERLAWTRADLRNDPHDAADKPQRVQRMFTAIARSYDLNNRLHSFGCDQRWRRRVVKLAAVRPSDEVLDAACGTGDLTILFARSSAARVVGVDFAPAMLEIAREKWRRRKQSAPPSGPLEFITADVMDLEFDDATFDIVSIAFGIRNVGDTGRALREFRRVLRPDGRLLILEFSRPPNRVVRGLHTVYCRHIMPRTATLIARDRSGAYRYLPRSIETYIEGDEMAAMIRDAGFEQVSQDRLTFGVCTIHQAQVSSLPSPIES